MTDHSPADAGGPASGPPQSSLPSPQPLPTPSPPPPPTTTMAPRYPLTQGVAWQGEGYDAQPDAPLSTASLVLGILGLIPYPLFFVLAPVAIICSLVGKSKVRAFPPGTYRTGKLTAGLVMGIIGTVLLVALVIMFFLLFSFLWVLSDPAAN